jgi:hypothetical protein
MADTECPVCTDQLKLTSGGETLRAFATPSEAPSSFGSDIVSLECGHRLHRFCLVRWLQTSQTPSCPTCRALTQWQPTLQERQQLVPLIQQGWKILAPREKSVIKYVWIFAAVACLTDPIVLVFLAFFFLILLPPIFFPSVLIMLAAARQAMGKTEPGSRMFYSLGIASIITLVVLLHNHAVNDPSIEPSM